jgi:hypothetical protein
VKNAARLERRRHAIFDLDEAAAAEVFRTSDRPHEVEQRLASFLVALPRE